MPMKPPHEVYVITVQGEWPLHVLENESHAMSMYERLVGEKAHNRVRIWRCKLTDVRELKLVRENAYLEPMEGERTDG